ncbi:MAG TPA: STAS domain-containing protein [Steroidobacteraceae bacterium]|jgi:rsbT co-antagonist protein RsbR|nr:STAS domain-containing protein [Steroidobacteraceae bacterium]
MAPSATLANALQRHQKQLLSEWVSNLQSAASDGRKVRISPQELGAQAEEFLQLLTGLLASASPEDRSSSQFKSLQGFLEDLSRTRVQQGFTSAETATFIFSFKQPLFTVLRTEAGNDANLLADEIWKATKLLDEIGLITVNTYQRAREEVINRQQQEMLELSTPVVKLWEGILALPMIGTLDSARTQIVMEALLHKIVETGSQLAIIDITGVPTVDTLVAQHLLKTVTAIRLMGADCIISGVRPQIAQTIVHLGVDLAGVTTKANLADALALALKRTGNTLSR